MDAVRAKRVYEQSEREARLKEKNEEMIRRKRIEELIASNEQQKKNSKFLDNQISNGKFEPIKEESYTKVNKIGRAHV